MGEQPLGRARTLTGWSTLALAGAGWSTWIAWRLTHLTFHPVAVAVFLLELLGAASGLVIGVALLTAEDPRREFGADRREPHRFAFAVADVVGRTRAADLHRDIRETIRASHEQRLTQRADLAMAGLMTDGPRCLALVAMVTVALLIGVAPVPVPPLWAGISLAAGVVGSATAHVVAADGRLRFGDRTRWSFAALGEVLSSADEHHIAPRRWIGAVAAVVVVNVAIALRGMSDRWTHGLSPMDRDDRIMAMALGVVLVAGALFTLRTTTTPQMANARTVSRHLEERTARQSAVGAAVVVGVIGLLAGTFTGSVSADDPVDVPTPTSGLVAGDPASEAGDD
ncbi:MAG: hypothetical protein QNJ12_11600 [Ilumatobacter sp.]|uniref:hypothetical protein n=1 Tax=Ilumatobacter sp. TaxID=1967498 RepID=UPI0026095479|nr:hypothetical protein [Ilumatobacter sp.]MDJ0769434.1 hypothetical protein [Ilumatobacter sp.]